MKKKIKLADMLQLGRFAVVGISNSVIDFGILNLLLWLYPTTNTWQTLGYNSLAVLLASTNSFFWNKYWTFQQKNKIEVQEVYRFAVLAISTTVMNDSLMLLLSKIFPTIMRSSLLGANALKLGAIIGTMSISFFGMRLWVFFQKKRVAGGISSATGGIRSVTGGVKSVTGGVKSVTGKTSTVFDDEETLKLPVFKLVYDVNLMINGVIKPIYEIDTLILPAIEVEKQEAFAE